MTLNIDRSIPVDGTADFAAFKLVFKIFSGIDLINRCLARRQLSRFALFETMIPKRFHDMLSSTRCFITLTLSVCCKPRTLNIMNR